MINANMHYTNVLQDFKIEYEGYTVLKNSDAHEAPAINDKDNDRKVINGLLSSRIASQGHLVTMDL